MSFTGLTVVIPTRNRASLAMNAIRSVLEQATENTQILVSDNSTNRTESDQLSAYCRPLDDKGVRYVTPPEPMSMTRHWDWAIETALESSDFSHFTYLSDRMIFKNSQLAETIEVAKLYPGKILTFNHDAVVDHTTPVRVIQLPWTGNVFEIRSERLTHLFSRCKLHNCLPRMLNTIVPRSCLEEVKLRFGNVFDSISPDFCFCFRVLETFDSILFFDKSVLLQYALFKSNGHSGALGRKTDALLDFLANLGDTPMNSFTPIPEIVTVFNGICDEYWHHKSETGSAKFPEIDRDAYLRANAYEITKIEDPNVRQDYEALLLDHGWRPTPTLKRKWRTTLRKLVSPPVVANKIKWLARGKSTKQLWLLFARFLSIPPPADNRFEFRSAAEAFEFVQKYPRGKERDGRLSEPLFSATAPGEPLSSELKCC